MARFFTLSDVWCSLYRPGDHVSVLFADDLPGKWRIECEWCLDSPVCFTDDDGFPVISVPTVDDHENHHFRLCYDCACALFGGDDVAESYLAYMYKDR